MNVLHVIPSLEREDGGPAAAIDGMIRGIANRGARVTVATTARIREADTRSTGTITTLRFPRSIRGSWKYSRALGRWLRQNSGAFDVVHVHALFSYATIPACRNAMASGVPLIVRPLGTLDPWCLAHHSWKKRPYLRFIERAHLHGASAIHVTSELERRTVATLGYGTKARIIPLGVPSVATAGCVREAHGAAARRDRLNVLFLSRLHPKKGLPFLIEALARLRDDLDFTLHIAGSGPDHYVAKLRQQCDGAGIGDRVEFLGHVSGERKDELFRCVDLFVLPSHQENFSIAAVEAMAAGLPVILSDQIGVAADAAAADAGLIVSTEVPAIVAAIRKLAGDSDLRLRMGLAGRALVESRFTWAAASDALLELYEELCAGRRRSSANPPSHPSFPLETAPTR